MSTGFLPYAVNPDVSVYALVDRLPQQATFVNHRRTMSIISNEIENATLLDSASTRIFAGFQFFSKFIPQIKRYERQATRAESIYVFGVPDITPPPITGIRYMRLTPEAQLAREWFVVSYGRDYLSALATEEQSRFTDPDDQRVFRGIWSFDPDLVVLLHDWLSNLVNAPDLHIDETRRDAATQLRIMGNSMSRIISRVAGESSGSFRAK